MSAREVIAYAITHAPRGQRGGPYESVVNYGAQVAELGDNLLHRFSSRPSRCTLSRVRKVIPHARVIRIVRARPSEASAVQVLRELAELHDAWLLSPGDLDAIMVRARRALYASGPDPMPVVRAAMRYLDHGPDGRLGPAWVGFREAGETYREAVDAYRKAGGK